nr:uncharacterized protein LOC109183675 [Ipomoea trifida]
MKDKRGYCTLRVCIFQIQKDIHGRNKRKVDEEVNQGNKRHRFNSTESHRNFSRNGNNNNGRGQQNQGQGQGFVKRNQMGERHYHCKICRKDHPGADCQGNPMKCFNCNRMGHRAYECYIKNNENNLGQMQSQNMGNQNANRLGNFNNRRGNGGD